MKISSDGSRLASLIVLCVALLLANMYCGGDDGKSFAPFVELLSCPPDTVCEGTPCAFVWAGSDRNGRIEGYYHGLNDDSPGDWTTSEACTLLCAPIGRHVFYVVALDDEGRTSDAASCAFTVVESNCLVIPGALDFGTVDVGMDSVMSFAIVNSGGSPVSGSIVETCDVFDITDGGGPFHLGGGQSREVAVRFSPAACETSECIIDMGNPGCPGVGCMGVGGGVACDVTPLSLDFGSVTLGESSDLTFMMAGAGCEPLAGIVAESCGDYSVVDAGSYSLEPGRAQTVTVRFSPSSCGPSECTIDTGNSACAMVHCSGVGVGASCEIYPKMLDFGEVGRGYEVSRSFRIRNSGCVVLEGTLSESCPSFSIESSPSWSLSPGESKEVLVKFAPLACDGESSCWIDPGNPHADSVHCTGVVGCGCWVSDSDMYHDFGCLEADQSRNKDFYVKNLGGDTLRLEIRLKPGCAGGFYFSLGGGHQVIAPDQEHQVIIRFSPLEAPSYECTLDLGECGEIRLVGSLCGGGDTPLPTAGAKCSR